MKNSELLAGDIIVVGAGGHASVVVETAFASNLRVLGIIADNVISEALRELQLPLFDEDAVIQGQELPSHSLVIGLGILSGSNRRRQLYKAYGDLGYSFPVLCHLHASIARSVRLGEGVQVFAGSVIQPNVCIGAHSIVNTSASIDHDVTIGRDCHIAPGVTICGGVNIGDNVFVGAGSTVVNGVSIADNTFIRAGSLVTSEGIV